MKRMMDFIDKLNKIMGIVTAISIFLLLLLVLWGVFSRYVLRSPSNIALEVSGYFMVLLSFLGAGYILLKEKHVSVQVLSSRIPKRFKKFHDLSIQILLFIFSMIVIYEGISYTILAFEENYRSTSLLNFPLWVVFLTIPVGMFFFLLQVVRNILFIFYKRG